MVGLRVTKYSPALRDSYGNYTRDEWTSISDIGRQYGDSVFTLEDYLSVESEYVSVVLQMMQAAGITELGIRDLEKHEYGCSLLPLVLQEECSSDLGLVSEGKTLDIKQIPKVVRLQLREVFWSRLVGARDFYVHFGYDYYMYVGFSGKIDDIHKISTPLFLEPFVSPYHPEDETYNG